MDERIAAIERRLARIESRLVQLMLFLGANPNERYALPAIVRRVREVNKTSA